MFFGCLAVMFFTHCEIRCHDLKIIFNWAVQENFNIHWWCLPPAVFTSVVVLKYRLFSEPFEIRRILNPCNIETKSFLLLLLERKWSELKFCICYIWRLSTRVSVYQFCFRHLKQLKFWKEDYFFLHKSLKHFADRKSATFFTFLLIPYHTFSIFNFSPISFPV